MEQKVEILAGLICLRYFPCVWSHDTGLCGGWSERGVLQWRSTDVGTS